MNFRNHKVTKLEEITRSKVLCVHIWLTTVNPSNRYSEISLCLKILIGYEYINRKRCRQRRSCLDQGGDVCKEECTYNYSREGGGRATPHVWFAKLEDERKSSQKLSADHWMYPSFWDKLLDPVLVYLYVCLAEKQNFNIGHLGQITFPIPLIDR